MINNLKNVQNLLASNQIDEAALMLYKMITSAKTSKRMYELHKFAHASVLANHPLFN